MITSDYILLGVRCMQNVFEIFKEKYILVQETKVIACMDDMGQYTFY